MTMISVSVGHVVTMLMVFTGRLAFLIGRIKTVPGPILLVVPPVGIVLNSQEINPMCIIDGR